MKFTYPDGSKPLEGYTIDRGIGVGGFGEVYFAHSDAGKEVALKRIQRNLDVELRGVRQCLNLKHVNLITLWDIRTCESGESWVVMEYVPGPSLRDLVFHHQRGMPEDEIKRWFASTSAGVAYLHEKGIVHRDLKPGNIFCDEHEQVIKIGDYGLSKFISQSRRGGQTESVGTFHYMAPEIGNGVYGKQIDIYSLGIILFEMLTGDVPFNGESFKEIIWKHALDDPDLSKVPEKFRRVISKALRKDMNRRYEDVQAMVADLPWPEIARKSEEIILQNSVGAMNTFERANGANTKLTAEHAAHIETDGTKPKTSQLPPVIISSDDVHPSDIVFGPLRDSTRGGPNGLKITNPCPDLDSNHSGTREGGDGGQDPDSGQRASDPIQVLRTSNYGVVTSDHSLEEDGQSKNGLTTKIMTSSSNLHVEDEPEEPIARVVQSGMTRFVRWWNNANFSAPVKILLLIIGGIVVVKNSQWLLPLVVISSFAYLAYYLIRARWIADKSKSPWQIAQLQRQQRISDVRDWLKERPAMDRTTEIVGSFLVAAFACIVLSLLGMTLSGDLSESSLDSWARYVWVTLVSMAGAWALLGICKSWEITDGNVWLRRLTMIGIGVGVGGLGFMSASSFGLNLSQIAADDFARWNTRSFVFDRVPLLPAFLIFHGGLFGIVRWWRQMDPVRRTRLSTLSVAFCLLWSILLSHFLNVPLTLCCIFAVVTSVSIQLASPWLHPSQQLEISEEQAASEAK